MHKAIARTASKMCSIAETDELNISRFLINLFKCLRRVYMYKGRNIYMNRQDLLPYLVKD